MDFDLCHRNPSAMEKQVNKILKILKDHVNQNNREIQFNQEEINKLLSLGGAGSRKEDLDFKYSINKELLEENDNFIDLQLRLNEFMERFGYIFSDEEAIEITDIPEANEIFPYFNKTVSGQMKYGPQHPQFHNNHFFNELINYYQEKENYEMCDSLIKIKSTGKTA